ncbi:hypothetical protein CEUSTIGMA_g11488.t1 [Chlamydomonas eustigma]|uniref:Uncharacterized protein n=1 Tax=Chlamydomonas eustigma TaxID=1157962 RepID=A0A250XLW7_9CHLO|nr:hypothetical protein CEUSTIGMA_g11488.t1 [Chlamydomonas eustigma]|eukprot:GAX84064.1 hypothetical protein CEUSTIGMA_g11488.t1 [Chlamydomonas eustigma]
MADTLIKDWADDEDEEVISAETQRKLDKDCIKYEADESAAFKRDISLTNNTAHKPEHNHISNGGASQEHNWASSGVNTQDHHRQQQLQSQNHLGQQHQSRQEIPEQWLSEVKAMMEQQQRDISDMLSEWTETVADRVTQAVVRRLSCQIPQLVSQLTQATVTQTDKSLQDSGLASVPSQASPAADLKQTLSPIQSAEKASVFSRLQVSCVQLGNSREGDVPQDSSATKKEPGDKLMSSSSKVKVKAGFVPYRPKVMTGPVGGSTFGIEESAMSVSSECRDIQGDSSQPVTGSRTNYGEGGISARREQKAHPYDQHGPGDYKSNLGSRYLDR